MRRYLSLAREDLAALTRRYRGMLLVLLAPPLALLLAARGDGAAPVRLLLAGGAAEARPELALDRLARVLQQSSAFTVAREQKAVANPLARMTRDGFDLLLNYGEAGTRDLSIYTAETDPPRLARLEDLAAGILRTYAFLKLRAGGSEEAGESPGCRRALFPEVSWARIPIYEELFMLGSFPVNPTFEYFPQAAEPRLRLFPAAIALILGMVPFALGVAAGRGAVTRAEGRTWKGCAAVALAKAAVPCLVTLMNFVLMLLVLEALGGFQVKAGVFRFLLFLVPALLAAACLGLGAAWLARSPLELASACMLYGLVLALAGGFSPPLAEGFHFGRAAAALSPTTFVRPALARWMFGAPLDGGTVRLGGLLVAQSLLYVALAAGALRWRQRALSAGGAVDEEMGGRSALSSSPPA